MASYKQIKLRPDKFKLLKYLSVTEDKNMTDILDELLEIGFKTKYKGSSIGDIVNKDLHDGSEKF